MQMFVQIQFHDAVVLEMFTSPPPHSDTTVCIADAKPTLICEHYSTPLPPVPVGVVSGPL